VPNLERYIKDMQDKLPLLDFEGKRLALNMLGITVYLDGENVFSMTYYHPSACP
jgi:hypothetical protein